MIDIEQLKAMMKPASTKKQVEDSVPAFELDDDGEEYMSVGTDGVLAASEKLLAINRGLDEPDERDSLRFQKILRPHAMLRESIKMDAGKVSRQLMYQAARRKNLSGLSTAAFDPYVERLLVGNPLTAPLEEINPMQLTESARRITKMGPGGLGSSDSITEEAQAIHPSQFGYISVIEGPESERAGIDVRVAWGAKLGSNGRLYQKYYDRHSKKMRWMSPEDVANLTVKIPD